MDYFGESISIDSILGTQDFGPLPGPPQASSSSSGTHGTNGSNSNISTEAIYDHVQFHQHSGLPQTSSTPHQQSNQTSQPSQHSQHSQHQQTTSNSSSQPLPNPPLYAAAYPLTFGLTQMQQYPSSATARLGEAYPPTPSPENALNGGSLGYQYVRPEVHSTSVSTNSRSSTPSRGTPLLQEFILPIQVRAAPFCDTNDILEMGYDGEHDLETFEDYSSEPAANFTPAPYTGTMSAGGGAQTREVKRAEEIAITRMKYHKQFIDLGQGMFGKLNLRKPGAWQRNPSGSHSLSKSRRRRHR